MKDTFNLTGYETFYGITKIIKFVRTEYGTLETGMLLKDFPKNYNFDTCTVYFNESAEYEWNSEDYTDTKIADNLLMSFLAYNLNKENTEFKFEVVLQNECGSENLIITQ